MFAQTQKHFRLPENPDAPVIVGNTGPISLVLRKDGLVVVLCEKGKLRVEWWTVPELLVRLQAQENQIQQLEEQARSQPPVLP